MCFPNRKVKFYPFKKKIITVALKRNYRRFPTKETLSHTNGKNNRTSYFQKKTLLMCSSSTVRQVIRILYSSHVAIPNGHDMHNVALFNIFYIFCIDIGYFYVCIQSSFIPNVHVSFVFYIQWFVSNLCTFLLFKFPL